MKNSTVQFQRRQKLLQMFNYYLIDCKFIIEDMTKMISKVAKYTWDNGIEEIENKKEVLKCIKENFLQSDIKLINKVSKLIIELNLLNLDHANLIRGMDNPDDFFTYDNMIDCHCDKELIRMSKSKEYTTKYDILDNVENYKSFIDYLNWYLSASKRFNIKFN